MLLLSPQFFVHSVRAGGHLAVRIRNERFQWLSEEQGVCLTFRADGNHEFVKEP